ncbi:hypothetical protein HK101_006148 [Irineochytrium annulatum]|nr:hypothetical protein HK101_006148 [Irineochytrium annulatum]
MQALGVLPWYDQPLRVVSSLTVPRRFATYHATHLLTSNFRPAGRTPNQSALDAAISGAAAGVAVSAWHQTAAGPSMPRAIFPELASEFQNMIGWPPGKSPRAVRAAYVGRAAASHAAFFTVYEGLKTSGMNRLREAPGKGSEDAVTQGIAELPTSTVDPQERFVMRFMAGGIASLAYRAVSSNLLSQFEHRVMTPLEFGGYMSRSFVLAGLCMAVGEAAMECSGMTV